MAFQRTQNRLSVGPSRNVQIGVRGIAAAVAQRKANSMGAACPRGMQVDPLTGYCNYVSVSPPVVPIVTTPVDRGRRKSMGDPHRYFTPVIRRNNSGFTLGDYFPSQYYLPSQSVAQGANFVVAPVFAKQQAMKKLAKTLRGRVRSRRRRTLGDEFSDPFSWDNSTFIDQSGGGGDGGITVPGTNISVTGDPWQVDLLTAPLTDTLTPTPEDIANAAVLDPCYVDPANCGANMTNSEGVIDATDYSKGFWGGGDLCGSMTDQQCYDALAPSVGPAKAAQAVAAKQAQSASTGGGSSGGGKSSGGSQQQPQYQCSTGFQLVNTATGPVCRNAAGQTTKPTVASSSLAGLFTPQNLLIGAAVIFGGVIILKSV
jgi:hypothetical protein